MGNQIGDYIHLRWYNYNLQGLERPQQRDRPVGQGMDAPRNYSSFYKKQRAEIIKKHTTAMQKRKLSGKDIQAYEDALNSFFNPSKSSSTSPEEGVNTQRISQAQQKAIIEAVNSYLNTTQVTEKLDFNENLAFQDPKLNMDISSYLERNPTSFNKLIWRDQQHRYFTEEEIDQKVKFLAEVQKKLSNISTQLKGWDAQFANGQIVSFGKFNDFSSWAQNIQNWWNNLQRVNYRGSKRVMLDRDKDKNIIEEINSVMHSIYTSDIMIHGKYAECVVGLTDYVLQQNSYQGVNQLLTQLVNSTVVKGNQRSRSGIKSQSLIGAPQLYYDKGWNDLIASTELAKKDRNKRLAEQVHRINSSNGDSFIAQVTQEKIDVDVTIAGQKIPASIKNYNLGANAKGRTGGDITLLSGRSVLSLLQGENTQAVNHALNILATHEKEKPRKECPSLDEGVFQSARQYIKMIIVAKAAAGDVFRGAGNGSKGAIKDPAALFIINDNSIGKFRVIPMANFLAEITKVINQEDTLNSIRTGDFDKVSFQNPLPNDYVGQIEEKGLARYDRNKAAANQRIMKLLAHLHRMKLKVIVPKSQIKGFFP